MKRYSIKKKAVKKSVIKKDKKDSTNPTGKYAAILLCISCGDSSCVKGERCGYDRTEGGLFSTQASSSALPVLPYGSTNAKKNSGKAFGTELEHPIPGQTLRLMGQGGTYRREYTIPTPNIVHRGGVSGGGGGISSTGYSDTARGWAQHLASQNPFDQVKAALNDQINAHIMQNNFNEGATIQLKDWLLSQQLQSQRINRTEYEQLLNLLMNRYYDRK